MFVAKGGWIKNVAVRDRLTLRANSKVISFASEDSPSSENAGEESINKTHGVEGKEVVGT